jgi:nondiscriminating aspartyl-tRNA synthetase
LSGLIRSRVPLEAALSMVDEVVVVGGFVQAARKQKDVQFVVIRDGLSSLQLTHRRENSSAIAELIDELTEESVVVAKGRLVRNERVRLGGVELLVEEMELVSRADPLPLSPDASLDARLDWRFLDLRSPRNQLLFRVQTEFEAAFRDYCRSHGLVEIHSPKLMASPSESRSELFEVKYFDRKAYLAQSPQFFKQMGIAAGFPGVFEIGPVFRANPSFTSRHDTEFTSMDVEIGWVSSHEDVMSFEERLIEQALGRVEERFGKLIAEQFGVTLKVPSVPFPRLSHSDAVAKVQASGHAITRADGDLDPEGERRLAAIVAEEQAHEFVFVTDYPWRLRPFYHMRHEGDQALTKSFDLLWKGLEITTGAQREHRHEVLVSQVREKGLDESELSYYLDFFRFGCPPHGGFGFGLSRFLMVMLGLSNVREATYLYRGPNRLRP